MRLLMVAIAVAGLATSVRAAEISDDQAAQRHYQSGKAYLDRAAYAEAK